VYLADGLTEELTERLGDVQRLRVSGRNAVHRAQQTVAGDFSALGRALGVRYLVEGSVRRDARLVRISVRLLRASDGVRVWGETYDRGMADVLALEGEIAEQVATNVAGQLLPGERATLSARQTTNAEAYDHFLRGSYFVGLRSTAGFQRAVEEFDAALERDPRFAAAEARRAYAYSVAWAYGADWAPGDTLAARAARSAEAAIRLDSTSSDAWLARGEAAAVVGRDFVTARAAEERAVALDPRNAEAVHSLGVTYMFLGADGLAIAQFHAALKLDPARAVDLLDLSEVLYALRRQTEALPLLDSALAIDPGMGRAYIARARVRLMLGDVARAHQDARQAIRLAPPWWHAEALAVDARADVAGGDTAAANARVAEIERLGTNTWGYPIALLAVGRDDSALAALERLHLERISPGIVWSYLPRPEFDRVRASPRFRRLVEAWRPAGAVR
jgi:adenylate cyclase